MHSTLAIPMEMPRMDNPARSLFSWICRIPAAIAPENFMPHPNQFERIKSLSALSYPRAGTITAAAIHLPPLTALRIIT